jgi:hypothetical protein
VPLAKAEVEKVKSPVFPRVFVATTAVPSYRITLPVGELIMEFRRVGIASTSPATALEPETAKVTVTGAFVTICTVWT